MQEVDCGVKVTIKYKVLKMDELSLIISILAALLTGGFLMFFIESQKVANDVAERFHFIMNPFFHSFTSYVRFISSFKTCFNFKKAKESNYISNLKEDVDRISKLGGQSIMWGQNFPANYFTAEELDSVCNSINNIWYIFDRYQNFINIDIEFDSHHADMISNHTKEYMEGISPKYIGKPLTEDMLSKVSGDFFVDFYQPVQNVLHQYEFWQSEEKRFKTLIMITVAIILITMILILLFNLCVSLWIYKVLCVVCCIFLLFGLYKLIKIENLSKTIMR